MSFPKIQLLQDFWRVSSYGYPCYFMDSEKSQVAWKTLLSFFQYEVYSDLKDYWTSGAAERVLSTKAVESWKAAFEEFGVLYVQSRSNRITITPAGRQLMEAANNNDRDGFCWIGLNLLLRYPLRGPRRPKSELNGSSDLLLYRFLYSAMLELDDHLWWSEVERVMCRVFTTDQASDAVDDIRKMRADPRLLKQVPKPVVSEKGYYNSLNQVFVHAGMNHLILGSEDTAESIYGEEEPSRRQYIEPSWKGLIKKALNNSFDTNNCAASGSVIARLPSAPELSDEQEYFDYLGASVTPYAKTKGATLSGVVINNERILLLKEQKHYLKTSDFEISGDISDLCQISKGQRLILDHDVNWTYFVEDKLVTSHDKVKVVLRRARPITDFKKIIALFGG